MYAYTQNSCIWSCICGDSILFILETSEYEQQMLVCVILLFQKAEQKDKELRIVVTVCPRPSPHYRAGHKQNIHLSLGA